MARLFRALFIVSLLFSVSAFAQTADQEVVSVVDSPDPVAPGAVLTYTVTLTNHGPDPSTGGGLNINLPSAVTHQNSVAPPGFTCFYAGSNGNCGMPSLPVGTYVITINVVVGAHLAAFPDQDILANFFPSGTTIDPNSGNNSKLVTTTVDSPQVDLSVSATDSPDPVFPDGTLTYTIDVANGGPDSASTVNFNGVPNPSLAFQSVTAPAGWTCLLPAVGALNATFTCSRATWAPQTQQFIAVYSANDENLGINDFPLFANFSINSGASHETDHTDNSQSLTTQYTTPDADMTVSVSDSPDPVFPDGNITYTINVGNSGPDAAPNAMLNFFNNGTLQYQSVTAPAGWSCTPPAVNATPTFSCTNPSFASGGAVVFTMVVHAEADVLGINDGSVTTHFSVGSGVSDPNNANNGETESTAYVTPDADMTVAVTDSPDPVFPDGNITYTINVGNSGPDTAPNATLNFFNNGTLQYQSVTAPAGWSCTPPAVNATPTFSCTTANFPSGSAVVFTMVVHAEADVLGINDGSVSTHFSVGSGVSDPNNANNGETESTAYVTPDADMTVAVTDSPDPVFPDGNITYTINVGNSGPDTAPNATLNFFNNGTLQYQSVSAPAGWSCTPPAVGATPTFGCTTANFPSGSAVVFTLVVHAEADVIGIHDGTVSTHFTVGSGVSDPNNANNGETESTAYVTPDADMTVAVTDSPDPVFPDGNITYTINVGNSGPDTAPNATLNFFNNGALKFQSISAPAGWTCTPPAVNATPTFSCTNPSFASGGAVVFTLVARADAAINGINDGTLSMTFGVVSSVSDPVPANNSETENTAYVTPDADLAVTNADSPDPVSPGGTITYTQSVRNDGPDPATNATFAQTLESSVGFQSISAPAGWSCATPAVGASGNISCTNPSLASGATANFTVAVTVIASSGIVTNTVVASSGAQDPDSPDNSASVTTTILAPVVADLGITKATQSNNAAPGSSIAYTITLTNNGPDAAPNVVVTDTLPAGLLFLSITEPAGFNCTTPAVGANGTITCTAASMSSGTTATFTLVVQVAGTATGTINNTATATSDADDNNAGNGSGSAAGVTVGGAGNADLSVAKSTTTTNASAGDTVTYTIVATNNGPDAANEVIVNDTLPPSLLFQSITPAPTFTCTTPAIGANGTITCIGGPLANGATATFTLVTTIAPGATGSVANSVTVSSSDSDSNNVNSNATAPGVIVGTADLAITKTTNVTQAPTGSTIDYTITVTNNGPDPATNVIVNDDLPAGLQFVSATPSQGSCNNSDPLSCNLGTLAGGASATIALQALVTATSGTVTNTATVSSDVDDDNLGNNTGSSAPTPVAPGAGEATGIPTLSEWALMGLIAMLAMAAVLKMRM